MRAATDDPRDEVTGRRTGRHPLVLVAAAVLAAVVVAAVLVFGVARPPQLATIADDPALTPPARLATHGWDDGDHCLTVVELDGTTRQPWCSPDGAELVGWGDRGVRLRSYAAADGLELTVDPSDGEVVDRRRVGDDHRIPDRGGTVVTSSRAAGGDVLELHLDDGALLWRVEAPDGYEVSGGWRSPDGSVIALVDSADRLLLVPADGSSEPRVWAEDVHERYEVVWEGGDRA